MDVETDSVRVWKEFAEKRRRFFNRHNPKGLQAAFFERVAFGMSDCWYWIGSRSDIGYGTFGPSRRYGCAEIMAHRISWVLNVGAIPAGLKVLHMCDVRACVNPNHLFLGTQADNVHDMITKGRGRNTPKPGEKNGAAKLNNKKVIAMRNRYATGDVSFKTLAKEFNVSTMTAYRAVVHQSWSHI